MRLPGELNALDLIDAARRVASRDVSPTELTTACLERIGALEPQVNAFITVADDDAVYDAGERGAEVARGDGVGPLAGVPIALKDLFDTAGMRTTAGSKFFAERVPDEDAAVVRKLRDAGAVLLGKLNMHEWALGVTNDNPHYGPTHNPWQIDCIAVIRKHPNVWADISAIHYRPWSYYNCLRLATEWSVMHKLLFGSDG